MQKWVVNYKQNKINEATISFQMSGKLQAKKDK